MKIALTSDEQYLLVGDGNGSCIHLCQVRERLKLKTISNIPGLMGIAATDGGTVFLSSGKERALFNLREQEMLRGTETLTKVCVEKLQAIVMMSKVDGTILLLYAYTERLFSYAIPATK